MVEIQKGLGRELRLAPCLIEFLGRCATSVLCSVIGVHDPSAWQTLPHVFLSSASGCVIGLDWGNKTSIASMFCNGAIGASHV